MISHTEIVGKYLYYLLKIKNERLGYRNHLIVKKEGNIITTQDAVGEQYKFDRRHCKIFGIYDRETKEVEEIDWNTIT